MRLYGSKNLVLEFPAFHCATARIVIPCDPKCTYQTHLNYFLSSNKIMTLLYPKHGLTTCHVSGLEFGNQHAEQCQQYKIKSTSTHHVHNSMCVCLLIQRYQAYDGFKSRPVVVKFFLPSLERDTHPQTYSLCSIITGCVLEFRSSQLKSLPLLVWIDFAITSSHFNKQGFSYFFDCFNL